MGLIPDEIIAQVTDRCDIVELISSYVPLKKAGRNFKGHCPFHNEKTPSFIVNPDKQIFHCFGCDEGGNAIGFVMKHDHLTFPEAVRMLAQSVNVIVPETGGRDQQTSNLRQQIFDVNLVAAQFFHKKLLSDKDVKAKHAREYLKARRLDLRTVEQFQMGYAPDSWDGLINYLRSEGVNLSIMEKSGLIVARENKQGYYDRFRNRIMYPIFDTQGHCRAFGARSLENDDGKGISAKYINSPETPVYTKGQHFYGFHLAKQAIGRDDSVIIVEGYMDCIMPVQAGVKNIVASLGTALTAEQIRLIRRYTKNVVLLFDMDQAGESAMMRSCDTLIEEGMNVRVANLDEGHDPDSFIRKFGVDDFRHRIEQAQTLFDYKLGVLTGRYDVTAIEGKARISGEMLQTIDKFDNDILKAEYTKRLAQELSVPERALSSELNKIRQMTGDRKVFGKIPEPRTSVKEQIRVVESDILRLLLEERSFVEATKKEIDPSDFKDARIRQVISKIFDLCDQGKEINSAALINSFEDQEMQKMIVRIMAKEGLSAGDKKRMHSDYINRMKKDRIKLQMKELQNEIGEAEREGDNPKLDMLLTQYNKLIKEVAL